MIPKLKLINLLSKQQCDLCSLEKSSVENTNTEYIYFLWLKQKIILLLNETEIYINIKIINFQYGYIVLFFERMYVLLFYSYARNIAVHGPYIGVYQSCFTFFAVVECSFYSKRNN